jgi:hypothetical protein
MYALSIQLQLCGEMEIYPKMKFEIKLQYSIIGLVMKLKIDKAVLALLPKDRGVWRIPAYKELEALKG